MFNILAKIAFDILEKETSACQSIKMASDLFSGYLVSILPKLVKTFWAKLIDQFCVLDKKKIIKANDILVSDHPIFIPIFYLILIFEANAVKYKWNMLGI